MILYRIAPARFADDLSGAGAEMYGGRWNPVGVPMLYSANSTALALLETLVNVNQARLPALHRVVLELPDASIETAPPLYLPDITETQTFGKRWALEESALGRKVRPSVLPHSEDAFNVIINPKHPDAGRIKVLDNSPLTIDARLLGS